MLMACPSPRAPLGASMAASDLQEPEILSQPPDFAPDASFVDFVRASPNYGDRRGKEIDALVLHYTGMPTAEGALERLCDAAAEVSAHYLVYEDGRIAQLVPEAFRAWHAGRSFWAGESDMNSVSIGIEIVNAGHDAGAPDFPDVQIAAVTRLCADVMARRAIAANRLLAHSDIAPGRKVDPGEKFPWETLAAAGVGYWRPPAPDAPGLVIARGATGAPVQALQQALAKFGFGLDASGVYDEATETVVAAFQRRWRTVRVDGVADASTRATLAEVLG